MDETDIGHEIQATKEKLGTPVRNFSIDKLGNFILRFSNNLKKQAKSRNTIAAYYNDLSLFSKFLSENNYNPQNWDFAITEQWVDFLKQHNRSSSASIRRAQMSVRTFLHYLISIKAIENSPFLETKSPKQPSHNLLLILPDHFHQLLLKLNDEKDSGDEKAVRDLTIILTLGQYGLKATEAANLSWQDIFIDKNGGSLRINGTNDRLIPFDSTLKELFLSLKSTREKLGLPVELGAKLFFGYFNFTRKVRSPSLQRHGIKFVIYEICTRILKTPYNAESLRNYAIFNWLEQGLTIDKVAELAGYSSLNSLERFSLQTRDLRLPSRKVKNSDSSKIKHKII